LGFSVGYIGGIGTFWAWVRKLEEFSKVETISAEELLPQNKFRRGCTKPLGKRRCPIVEGLNVWDSSHILYMTMKHELKQNFLPEPNNR
jgi:hypothetical protein